MNTKIFLLILLLSFKILAGTCKEVDLRSKLGPVQEQDGTGWCYAYAASELVSFEVGKPVSAIDMAVRYHNTMDQYRLEKGHKTKDQLELERDKEIAGGGTASGAIIFSNVSGFCESDKVTANDINEKDDPKSVLGAAFRDLDDLSRGRFALDTATDEDCYKFVRLRRVFPGVTDFKEIEKLAKEGGLTGAGSKLTDKACDPRIKPKKPIKVKSLGPRFNKKKDVIPLSVGQFQQMDKVISSGKPVAISVFMEKFYNFGGEDDSKHAHHAMTIVGKRFNPKTGECEYIIKNSWGPDCSNRYKRNVRCEDGYLYVSAGDIVGAVYGADFIE